MHFDSYWRMPRWWGFNGNGGGLQTLTAKLHLALGQILHECECHKYFKPPIHFSVRSLYSTRVLLQLSLRTLDTRGVFRSEVNWAWKSKRPFYKLYVAYNLLGGAPSSLLLLLSIADSAITKWRMSWMVCTCSRACSLRTGRHGKLLNQPLWLWGEIL